MGRILCKYPNGAIHYYKPRYDGRQKPEKLIERINADYKLFPDHVGIIEFCCRGHVYTALETEGQWVIDGSKTRKAGK